MFELLHAGKLSSDSFLQLYMCLFAPLTRTVTKEGEQLLTELFWICEDLPLDGPDDSFIKLTQSVKEQIGATWQAASKAPGQ